MHKISKQEMGTTHKTNIGKRIQILVLSVLLLTALSVCGFCLYLNPILLKSDEVTAEYGEDFDPADQIQFVFFASPQDVEVTGEVDPSEKGEYELTYSLNGKSKTIQVTVADTKAPEVVTQSVSMDLTGFPEPEMFVKSAEDAQDITYAFKDAPNLDETGSSEISIIASDPDGNEAVYTAEFIRKEDKEGPAIQAPESLNMKQGQALDTSAITAEDELDPEPVISVDESGVDAVVPGTYSITVTATDRSGNSSVKQVPVVVEEDPNFDKKVVYLTFDDGPSQNTQPILDILERYGVKATFFVTGNGQEYNEMITKAAEQGHTIGLHTYSHRYEQIYASEDAYFADLQKISDMVKDLTGVESKVIRFPGGSSNTVSASVSPGIMSQLVQDVQNKGYQYFDWNVSSNDASGNNVAVSTIVSSSKAEGDDLVILFHDGPAKETTVQALPQIIEYYQSKGYVFAPLTVDSFPAHHGVNN